MIDVRVGELARAGTEAVLRPVAADWSAVTPATRRLELAAGAALADQCARLGELPVGSAVITGGGGLEAEYLVHVAVRSRDEPVTPGTVLRGLTNGLRRLAEWAVESAALPPLGTGAGNLDAEQAAELMVPLLAEHLSKGSPPTRFVVIVETEYERSAFARALAALDASGAAHREPREGSRSGGSAAGAPVPSPPPSPTDEPVPPAASGPRTDEAGRAQPEAGPTEPPR